MTVIVLVINNNNNNMLKIGITVIVKTYISYLC